MNIDWKMVMNAAIGFAIAYLIIKAFKVDEKVQELTASFMD